MAEKRKYIITQTPQINISYPSAGRMWLVCVCTFFCVFQSSLSDNGISLVLSLTAVISALLVELLLTWKKHGFSKVLDGSAAATAMILSALLPNQMHPVYAAFGAAFAIGIVKYSFGGLGSNWLNPALGGWLFIRFSWPSAFSISASIDELPHVVNTGIIDNSVTTFLNNTVFNISGTFLPSGYISLLFSDSPGIIADRGLFALLVGTVIVTAFHVSKYWIAPFFLFVYGFFIFMAGDPNGIFFNGDIIYGFFSGGTIAAAFILAAEPASGAKLKQGIILTVFLGAFFSWFFRYVCHEYSGCFIAIAAVNCLTPLINLLEEKYLLFRDYRGSV